MRITKRQLKRIIREEYSRLKRRGLIKEYGQNFDRELEEVGEMIAACKEAGMQLSQEQEKRYFESAYFMGNIDPELYELYDQCMGM